MLYRYLQVTAFESGSALKSKVNQKSLLCRHGLQKPVEFATVVTDLTTCHNTWFHPNVDHCFVPTDFARKRALKMGLQPQQITVHGLPIRPAFSATQPPKASLRKKLGMHNSKPAVLLVGEGNLRL